MSPITSLLGVGNPITVGPQAGPVQPSATSSTPSQGIVAGAVSSALSGIFTGLFSSRVIAIILGLILIAGALFLLAGKDIITVAGKVPA